MEKKLPSVFANNIEKDIANNKKVYMSNNKEEPQENTKKESKKQPVINKSINQKINEIMLEKKHVYKIPVKIKTKDKELIKTIIGKNNKNLITIENELIKIEDIIDIEIENEE